MLISDHVSFSGRKSSRHTTKVNTALWNLGVVWHFIQSLRSLECLTLQKSKGLHIYCVTARGLNRYQENDSMRAREKRHGVSSRSLQPDVIRSQSCPYDSVLDVQSRLTKWRERLWWLPTSSHSRQGSLWIVQLQSALTPFAIISPMMRRYYMPVSWRHRRQQTSLPLLQLCRKSSRSVNIDHPKKFICRLC